jgi:hypothetical protein
MLAAPDAATMLGLHARHARSISERAAPIFWVVEQAAPEPTAYPEDDPGVTPLTCVRSSKAW